MRKINVLHLSDLHLKYDNEVEFDSFLQNMRECILKINIPIQLITITGDLIDKGNVRDFSQFCEKFIIPISQEAKCPTSHVFCVPGNHDAQRDENILALRKKYEADDKTGLGPSIKREEIRRIIARFEDFSSVNETLHPDKRNMKSYGVDLLSIDDLNIALIRINSAIYSHDQDDYQKLGISKIQLDDLVKQYKAIRTSNKIDLSIALMHHPDDWLRKDEREQLWHYFTAKGKLPVDVIFHGHTHESKIAGKIDLDSFILSLVTGTTYEVGNKVSSGFSSCRFAVYQIDLEKNEIEGSLFITNKNGKFVPDTSSYNSVNNDGSFCIPYSQEAFKKTSTVSFPIPIDHQINITDNHVKMLDEMVGRMWEFEKACRRHVDAFSSVPKEEFEKDNTPIIKDWFMSIASSARTCLFDKNEIDDVRAHFRIYNEGAHIHFCATIGERQLTPIIWNSSNNLIFHAFEQRRSLVKSSNPGAFFDTNGEWDDFLTVPIFDKYHGNEIPKYSFGISIKGNNKELLSKKLELLSFMRIESLIDSIHASFRRRYLA